MLRSLKDLERYAVSATDADVGCFVQDFLLDDEHWAVRYLVVEAGGICTNGPVLISPAFFRQIDWANHCFHLALSLGKVKNSPPLDTHLPVSRQQERAYFRYYGSPHYWGGAGIWGLGETPSSKRAAGRRRWSSV